MYNAENPDVPADDWAFPDGADIIFQNCLSEAFARECVHDTGEFRPFSQHGTNASNGTKL